MKLPNQTLGPITLTKIDYVPSMSEETLAFTAVVRVSHSSRCSCSGLSGVSAQCKNDGHGGETRCYDADVVRALNAVAATLPPVPWELDDAGWQRTGVDLIDSMVQSALTAHEDAKLIKKGFTHEVSAPKLTSVAWVQKQATVTDARLCAGFATAMKQSKQCTPEALRAALVVRALGQGVV